MLLMLACAEDPPAPPAPLPPLPALGAPGAPGCHPLALGRPGEIEGCYGDDGLEALVWTVEDVEGGTVLAELSGAYGGPFEPGLGSTWEAPGLLLAVTRDGSRVRYALAKKGGGGP